MPRGREAGRRWRRALRDLPASRGAIAKRRGDVSRAGSSRWLSMRVRSLRSRACSSATEGRSLVLDPKTQRYLLEIAHIRSKARTVMMVEQKRTSAAHLHARVPDENGEAVAVRRPPS